MLRVTAEGLALTLYVGMPLDLWLAAWVVTGRGAEEYREAFLHLYHAEIDTIPIGGIDVEVVKPLSGWDGWWLEMFLWLIDPRAACLDGCQQSQRPVM